MSAADRSFRQGKVMQIVTSPADYQKLALEWRAKGLSHAQAPTMGALHEGHCALMREARARADRVSVTLFVNPIQFNSPDDLDRYPRTWDEDVAACERHGVDALFAPSPEAMYSEGFQTHVEVERLAGPLCGARRPGHFRGVTTVVMKLFMLGQPTHGVFGWKDAQQFLVLRRMARDLAIPIEMIGVETVRESDGLAMSSRNRRLSPAQRAAASAIHRGLEAAARLFEAGRRDARELLAAAREAIERQPELRVEYLEARSLETLEELETVTPSDALLAAAVWAGAVRLIDNVRF
jgi:pantoate--beta-alanine ligase